MGTPEGIHVSGEIRVADIGYPKESVEYGLAKTDE